MGVRPPHWDGCAGTPSSFVGAAHKVTEGRSETEANARWRGGFRNQPSARGQRRRSWFGVRLPSSEFVSWTRGSNVKFSREKKQNNTTYIPDRASASSGKEKGVSVAHDQALFALHPFVCLSLALNLHH